jgi:hypothetical protein
MTGGILRSNHPNGFGTGDIHVAVGGNLYLDEFTIGTGVERIYPNDIWIEGDGNTSQGAISSGALRIDGPTSERAERSICSVIAESSSAAAPASAA